jgi:hypothetical protein
MEATQSLQPTNKTYVQNVQNLKRVNSDERDAARSQRVRAIESIQKTLSMLGSPEERVEIARKGQHLPVLAWDWANPKVLDIVVKNPQTSPESINRIGTVVAKRPNFEDYVGVASSIVVQRRSSDEIRQALTERIVAFKQKSQQRTSHSSRTGMFDLLRTNTSSMHHHNSQAFASGD